MLVRTSNNIKLIDIIMFFIREERGVIKRFILEGTYGSKYFFTANVIEMTVENPDKIK